MLKKAEWPGEDGRSEKYIAGLNNRIDFFRYSEPHRIKMQNGFFVVDIQGIKEYVDPRSYLRVIQDNWDFNTGHSELVVIRDHPTGGRAYTLGVIPFHQHYLEVDYHKIYPLLNKIETQLQDIGCESWGGRATVGGSMRNIPSLLKLEDIIKILNG